MCQSHYMSWVDDLVASLVLCSHYDHLTMPSYLIHYCDYCLLCYCHCCCCFPSYLSRSKYVHLVSLCRACWCKFVLPHNTFPVAVAVLLESPALKIYCLMAVSNEFPCNHLAFLAINFPYVERHNLGKQYQEHLRLEKKNIFIKKTTSYKDDKIFLRKESPAWNSASVEKKSNKSLWIQYKERALCKFGRIFNHKLEMEDVEWGVNWKRTLQRQSVIFLPLKNPPYTRFTLYCSFFSISKQLGKFLFIEKKMFATICNEYFGALQKRGFF